MIKTIVCIIGIIVCVVFIIHEIIEYIRIRNFEKAVTQMMVNDIEMRIRNTLDDWEKRFLK